MCPAVDQLDRLAADDMAEELRDHPRAAFLGRVDRVEAGADPVERAEQRIVEPFLHAVRVDNAVHQLLGAGIDPTRFPDRSQNQLGCVRIEFVVATHTINLGGRRKHDALFVPHAGANDREVGFEVELEHAQGLAHVGRRRRDRHQRQHGVALLDVVFDPLPVDRDVAFEEMESLLGQQVGDPIGLHVHPVDLPVGRGDDPLGEVMADEAVDAEEEDSAH